MGNRTSTFEQNGKTFNVAHKDIEQEYQQFVKLFINKVSNDNIEVNPSDTNPLADITKWFEELPDFFWQEIEEREKSKIKKDKKRQRKYKKMTDERERKLAILEDNAKEAGIKKANEIWPKIVNIYTNSMGYDNDYDYFDVPGWRSGYDSNLWRKENRIGNMYINNCIQHINALLKENGFDKCISVEIKYIKMYGGGGCCTCYVNHK